MSSPARLSSSPIRGFAGRERLDWPWSANSSHRLSSQSSIHGGSTTPGGYSSTGYQQPAPGYPPGSHQWSFTGFEWLVTSVAALKDYVEDVDPHDSPLNESDSFEVLKNSPVLDGKFKLEIARSPSVEGDPTPSKTLSIYITSLALEFAHPEFELSAGLMASIKAVGERGARTDWLWEHWHPEFIFRHESEVWECALPLSELLDNPKVRDTDSFVVCIQVHSPTGPVFPSQPSAYYVPRDLLNGVEASLDNPNTGDVRFVCLERMSIESSVTKPSTPVDSSERRSSSRASTSPLTSHITARKRIIYAHSDILVSRSEYFSTMLTSSFSENTSRGPGERKLFTVVVEEADYETIYWLCKWVYANYLQFKPADDYRSAVDGVGAGWSARWLNMQGGGEWDWKTFKKNGSERGAREDDSVSSVDSLRSTEHGAGSAPMSLRAPPPAPAVASSSRTTGTSTKPTSSPSKQTAPSTAPRRPTAPTTAPSSSSSSAATSRVKPVSIPMSSIPPTTYSTPSHYPISPRAQHTHPTPDPHPHPTPVPPPASALSMYQVAHRYAMPGLTALALEHLMATITPQSSFSLLLACSMWDELRSLVEDYVVEKWEEVSHCDEFEQCCQEIAAGEWGEDGSKVLVTVFRRLRAPSATLAYTRAL